jgi:hypothetical protein
VTGTSAFAALALVDTNAVAFAIPAVRKRVKRHLIQKQKRPVKAQRPADGPNAVVLTYGAPLAFLAAAV